MQIGMKIAVAGTAGSILLGAWGGSRPQEVRKGFDQTEAMNIAGGGVVLSAIALSLSGSYTGFPGPLAGLAMVGGFLGASYVADAARS